MNSRIFFLLISVVSLVLGSCQTPKEEELVSIIWENDRAVGLTIRKVYATDDDIPELEVRLIKEGERAAVLGTFTHNESDITFTPVVPLTLGLRYEILEEGISIGEIEIPQSTDSAPDLLAIYPSTDTVPENLLKVYLRFSQPMAEGRSANYVHLLKNGRDTMAGTFLDLQPELWNEDGTVLTLWLDPGRIKLDLIPNKELGNPLERDKDYALIVAKGWKSREGIAMAGSTSKRFHVAGRDEQLPDVEQWKLQSPQGGTDQPLTIDFGEPLDRMLAEGTMKIVDQKRAPLEGAVAISDEDQKLQFKPATAWITGEYFLIVESRLEDLAGNNLNRLFETDLSKATNPKAATGTFERKFLVQ